MTTSLTTHESHDSTVAVTPRTGSTLSPGELAVLRKITTDGAFRTHFVADPLGAIASAGIEVTEADHNRLQRLSQGQLQQAADAVSALTGPNAATAPPGTHTLLYAVIVALLLA